MKQHEQTNVTLSPITIAQATWIMQDLHIRNRRLTVEYCVNAVYQYLQAHPSDPPKPRFPPTPKLPQ